MAMKSTVRIIGYIRLLEAFCVTVYYTYRSNEDAINDKTDYIVLFDPNKGEFSQWHPAECTLDGIRFNCAEQLMMYAKASKCMWIYISICRMIYCKSKSKSNYFKS